MASNVAIQYGSHMRGSTDKIGCNLTILEFKMCVFWVVGGGDVAKICCLTWLFLLYDNCITSIIITDITETVTYEYKNLYTCTT